VRNPPPPSATLTVSKLCVPGDDGGLFNLRVDGQTAPDQPCGGQLGPLVLSPGAHKVGESAGSSTSLGDYTTVIGGDCATDGTITLAAGQFASCTITNIRATPPTPEEPTATIAVTTACVPADSPSRFDVELHQSSSELACGDSTGPIVVPAGTHVIADAVTPQADPATYRVVYRGHCSPRGVVQVKPNAHAHCVVVHIHREPPGSFTPPNACHTLLAGPQTITAGTSAVVVARILIRGKPVRDAQVELTGPGVSTRGLTGADGHARFPLKLARPGTVVVRTQRQYGCPPVPARLISILGTKAPPVTG
jgi:hypothetical protein